MKPTEFTSEQCKAFPKYKGVKKPKCGCKACWTRYDEKHPVTTPNAGQ